jgi:hypothetical protein
LLAQQLNEAGYACQGQNAIALVIRHNQLFHAVAPVHQRQ